MSTNSAPLRRSSRLLAKRLKIDATTYSIISSAVPFENIPIEIFRLLIKSNYLTAGDLGKIVLFTSKKLQGYLFHSYDEVWETLLIARFGHSVCALTKALPNRDCDCSCAAEKLFRSLLKEPVFPKKEPVRPLKYSPDDYYLIVNVFLEKGSKANLTRVVHGKEIPSFFKNGKFSIKVEDLSIDDYENVVDTWEVTVHIMRIVDQKCCCLFQSGEGKTINKNAL